jgi:hypothetical protein
MRVDGLFALCLFFALISLFNGVDYHARQDECQGEIASETLQESGAMSDAEGIIRVPSYQLYL